MVGQCQDLGEMGATAGLSRKETWCDLLFHGVALASRFTETVVSIKLSLLSRNLSSDLQRNKAKPFAQCRSRILNLMIHAHIYPITNSHRYSHHSTIQKHDPEIVLGFFPAIYFCMEFGFWAWPSNDVMEPSRISFEELAEFSLQWVELKPKICPSHVECASAPL